jgi:hypothetical protein
MITIHVTQEDIDKGIRGDCKRCPVARAIERELPSASDINVDGCTVSFWHDGEYCRYAINEVEDFIELYDNDRIVEPFTFVIDNI